MRAAQFLLVLALFMACVGCKYIYGPREEVKVFINEKEDVLLALSKKVESDPTSAGVDAARKLFEEKKGSLVAKREAIYKAPRGKNFDWYNTLLESDSNDYKYFDMVRAKLIEKGADLSTMDKFRALEDDFRKTVKGE